MPRPRKLNANEFEICKRFALFRRAQGVSRTKAAKATGVEATQIERFEICRAPVRLVEALAFARAYQMSIHWLATGKGFELDPAGNERLLFGKLTRKGLLVSEAVKSVEVVSSRDETRRRFARAHARFFERLASTGDLDRLSTATLDAFNDSAMRAANELSRVLGKTIPVSEELPLWIQPPPIKPVEFGTSNACLSVMNPEASRWELLRKRLRAVTKERGAQKALSQAFGVSQQSVSQWLTGETVPSAENALRLVEWVAAAEAQQQKTPPVLAPRTGQVTRKDKNKTNEKAKPDRPKG